MLAEIGYTNIIGLSLTIWFGIFAFLAMTFAASIPTIIKKKWLKLNMKHHAWVARSAIVFAAIHILLNLASRFGW